MALMNFPHWVRTHVHTTPQCATDQYRRKIRNTAHGSQLHPQWIGSSPDSVYKEPCAPLRLYAEHRTFPAPHPCLWENVAITQLPSS